MGFLSDLNRKRKSAQKKITKPFVKSKHIERVQNIKLTDEQVKQKKSQISKKIILRIPHVEKKTLNRPCWRWSIHEFQSGYEWHA